MPLPTLVFVLFGIGVATALAAGSELRLSPRHAMLTHSFKAFVLFVVLLVLPTATYFYVFHGDWFLLYALDVRRVPSAVALLACLALCGVAIGAFTLGAALTRNQRNNAAYTLIGLSGLSAIAVVLVWRERLSLVGTFQQYHGDFGLRHYGGALLQAGAAMGAILLVGTAYLLLRIRWARPRA